MPEATLDWFVGNAAATNNVPRDTNFVHGSTPMRFHNVAIVNCVDIIDARRLGSMQRIKRSLLGLVRYTQGLNLRLAL